MEPIKARITVENKEAIAQINSLIYSSPMGKMFSPVQSPMIAEADEATLQKCSEIVGVTVQRI